MKNGQKVGVRREKREKKQVFIVEESCYGAVRDKWENVHMHESCPMGLGLRLLIPGKVKRQRCPFQICTFLAN